MRSQRRRYKRAPCLHTRVEMDSKTRGVLWQVGARCQCGGVINYGEER